MRTTMRKLLLCLTALLSVLLAFGLSACGSSSEEKQAEGYYEGPMQPKSDRVGSPGQQQGGQ
ncbi:MAG: hypothetical protein WHS44_00040 [Fimbriimonadales bacterium]|nr:MAG: hypothetical protein KatS3mg018_0939 [Fimbriimonadales bacterium]